MIRNNNIADSLAAEAQGIVVSKLVKWADLNTISFSCTRAQT